MAIRFFFQNSAQILSFKRILLGKLSKFDAEGLTQFLKLTLS